MIDTIQIARNLQEAGLTKPQAEAIAQSMLEIPDWANLATKSDLATLQQATKADLGVTAAELRTEIAKVKTELIYWFVGAFLLNAVVQIVVGLRH